ncbi:MAG TPA: amidohydrolase family protein [Conexibacter sp.]|jgi:predicted TIM-barrel fold metal-dependent hydrolase
MSGSIAQAAPAPAASEQAHAIIDCDVHHIMGTLDTLTPYLSKAWCERLGLGDGGVSAALIPYRLPWVAYMNPHGGMMHDALPPGGGYAGSDPQFAARQLFDGFGVTYGVLMGAENLMVGGVPSPDIAAELMRAYNDWTIDTWLSADERFMGSIAVAPQDPVKAAAEIRRLGDHPRMVQVGMPTGDRRLGHRYYDPIYDAAQEFNLPIAWHPGSESAGVNPHMTALSPSSSYLENSASLIQVTQAQLTSVLCEGTFEKFPRLKLVLIEGGVTWLPAVLWRLHRGWMSMRDELPWMKRSPEEYVKDHVRLATQPLDEPAGAPEKLVSLLESVGGEDLLMFSSDYPHWDFDNPHAAFRGFSKEWKRKIMDVNPRAFYDRLPKAEG